MTPEALQQIRDWDAQLGDPDGKKCWKDRRNLLGHIDELLLRITSLERERRDWQYASDVDVANAERLPIVEAENTELHTEIDHLKDSP